MRCGGGGDLSVVCSVCGMMAFGAVARVLSTDPELFTISSHLCGILNGITGIVVMAATGAVSAAWFPINERTTATSISQVRELASPMVNR